jgi:hypothetical protein
MSHHKGGATPPTAEQIDGMINSGQDPQNTPGANWGVLEAIANSGVTSLAQAQDELQEITGTTQNPASVSIEDFTGVSFTSMYQAFQGASGVLDNGNGGTLQSVSSSITNALQAFQLSLAQQDAKNDWVGKTHDAAIANINESLPDVTNISAGANALGLLIDAFSHTIFQTQWYLNENEGPYNNSKSNWPNEVDEINQVYDSFAQDVMNTVYVPSITSIASNNPGFSTPVNDPSTPAEPNPPPPPSGSSSGSNPPPPPSGSSSGSNPPPFSDPTTVPPPSSDLGTGSGTSGSSFSLPTTTAPGDTSGNGSSSDFELPTDAGPTDPSSGPGDSSAGSDDFALPTGTGITNPLNGSGSLPAGSGSTTGSNGAGITDPLTGAGDSSASASDPDLPTGTGIPNPLTSSGTSAAGASNPLTGSTNSGPGSSGAGLSGLGQAAQSLGQPLQQALGAAQNHQGSQPGAGLPGAPNGLDGPAKPGAGAGHGGGGAGIGSQGRDTLAPAGAPVAGATKGAEYPGTDLARTGTPGGAGGSAGGVPPGGGGGGGQRGPNAKEHKANKALRRKKNGELILGDVDAVVPVIGDDGPDEPEAPPRTPAPAAPPMPRPATAGAPRRSGSEQRIEVGR